MMESKRPTGSTNYSSNLSYEEKLARIQKLKAKAEKKEKKLSKKAFKNQERLKVRQSDIVKMKEQLTRTQTQTKSVKRPVRPIEKVVVVDPTEFKTRPQVRKVETRVVSSTPSKYKPIKRKNLKVSRTKNTLITLAILGVTGFCFYKSGFAQDIYSDIQSRIAIEAAKNIDEAKQEPVIVQDDVVEEELVEDEVEEVVEERHEVISTELYDSGYEFNQDITPSYLQTLNPQTSDNLAWIEIPGTHINYALAHPSIDNIDNVDGLRGEIDKSGLTDIDFMNQYFLHKDINGNKSSKGTLFMDINNRALNNHSDELSDFNVVYGHTMKNSTMFKDLTNWKYDSNGTYNDKHPFGIIYTDDGYGYKLTFITSRVVDGNTWEQLHLQNFESYEDKSQYISDIISDAKQHGWFTLDDYEVQPDDKFMCLTACSYDNMYGGKNDRYQLIGVLEKIKIRESDLTNNYDGYYVEENASALYR